ncbi:MAG: hypothetical protein C0506_02065 [Anaerolinea sp.]|nr:hypothetical protein [Anaerolinea sp.]
MKRKWVALLSAATVGVLAPIGAVVWGGNRDDDGLLLNVETIRPGVTCPTNSPNGAYKLDRWFLPATGVTYTKYPGTFPPGLDAGPAIDNAFTTWEGTEVGNVFSAADAAGAPSVVSNGTNAVFFAPLGGNAIATTYIWSDRKTKRLVEFDMVFNNYLEWGNLTGSGDCVSYSAFDVEDIAAHEIGHVVGVGHTSPNGANNAQSMYPYGQAGEIYKRSLADGDIAAANAKY